MKRRLIAMLALTAGIVVCQTPKDVDGWNKIKWGMTVVQAKAALGDQASDPPDANAAPAPPAKKTKTRVPLSPDEQYKVYGGTPNPNLLDRILIHDFKVGDIVMTVAIRSEKNSDVVSMVEIRGISFRSGPRV